MSYAIKVAALEARVAELEEKLAATQPLPEPEPEPVRIDSVPRDANGEVIVDPDLPSFEERMAIRRANQDREFAEKEAKRREGLPPGHWRDPCGMVRTSTGQVAARAEREAAELKKVYEQMAEEAPALRGES